MGKALELLLSTGGRQRLPLSHHRVLTLNEVRCPKMTAVSWEPPVCSAAWKGQQAEPSTARPALPSSWVSLPLLTELTQIHFGNGSCDEVQHLPELSLVGGLKRKGFIHSVPMKTTQPSTSSPNSAPPMAGERTQPRTGGEAWDLRWVSPKESLGDPGASPAGRAPADARNTAAARSISSAFCTQRTQGGRRH